MKKLIIFIRLFLIALFAWIIYAIPQNFLTLELFKIKNIKINGNTTMLYENLTELKKRLYNKNIWEINTNKIREKILEDIRVEEAFVSSPQLKELEIYVKEKELAYYAQGKDVLYLIDRNGSIFGYFKEQQKKPLIIIMSENLDTIKNLTALLNIFEGTILSKLVSQIYEKDKDRVEMILVDGGKIITNYEVDPKKYQITEMLYLNQVKKRKIDYLDIRFKDFIINYLGD